MSRRIISLVLAAVFLAFSFPVEAQQGRKIPRIGFLGNSNATLEANLVGPFREGLGEVQAAAQLLRIKVLSLGVRAPEELDTAFTTILLYALVYAI